MWFTDSLETQGVYRVLLFDLSFFCRIFSLCLQYILCGAAAPIGHKTAQPTIFSPKRNNSFIHNGGISFILSKDQFFYCVVYFQIFERQKNINIWEVALNKAFIFVNFYFFSMKQNVPCVCKTQTKFSRSASICLKTSYECQKR